MDPKRKKIERIYLIVTIVIIIGIILTVFFMISNNKKENDDGINLENNSFIEGKLKECEYTIWYIQMDYKAFGAPIKFCGYDSKYINVKTGKDYTIPYKNAIESVILKEINNASAEKIEEKMNEYKEKIFNFLEYTPTFISEFDRTKIVTEEVDKTKTIYENIKEDKTIHHIGLFEERINYEISFYVKDNNLIGEITYYIPPKETPSTENTDKKQEGIDKKDAVG